jgi:hypothetical protein
MSGIKQSQVSRSNTAPGAIVQPGAPVSRSENFFQTVIRKFCCWSSGPRTETPKNATQNLDPSRITSPPSPPPKHRTPPKTSGETPSSDVQQSTPPTHEEKKAMRRAKGRSNGHEQTKIIEKDMKNKAEKIAENNEKRRKIQFSPPPSEKL